MAFARNFYSAPFAHIGATVDLRVTARSLEIYHGHQRLSSHLLLPEGSGNEYRTNDADLPAGDRYQAWDAARVRAWADRAGDGDRDPADLRIRAHPGAGPGPCTGSAAALSPFLRRPG